MATQSTQGGTSTAVVLKLKPGMKLEASNLGDSGYVLYHINEAGKMERYFKATEQ